MLEVRGRFAVAGLQRPAVGHEPYFAVAHGDHRLDGDAHGRFEHHAIALASIVGHLWLLVHFPSDSMTGQFANHSISPTLTMVLNGTADVSDMIACHCLGDTLVESILRGLKQLAYLIGDLADTECVAGVATVAIKLRSTVDGNDVSLAKNSLCIGHPMDDNVVDRGADAGGKWPSKRIREVLERRYCTVIPDELLCNMIQLEGRYTWLNMFTQFCKSGTDESVCLAHQVDFIFGLQKYLHPVRSD